MTTLTKTLLGLFVVTLTVLGIYFFQGQGPAYLDPARPNGSSAPGESDDRTTPPTVRATDPRTPAPPRSTAPEPSREELTSPAGDGAAFAQGVQGTIVDEFDRPLAGADVYLMPGMGVETVRMHRDFQDGVRFPPISAMVTAADGRFKLGVERWENDKEYQIKVLREGYTDHKITTYPQPNDWLEMAPIQMKPGVVLFGRVTTETGLPVRDATITAKDASGILDVAPAPGREHGVTAITDLNGAYELSGLDPATMYLISVVAAGYAHEEADKVHLKDGVRHQLDFKLVPGLDIGGTVSNPRGEPVIGAKITVATLSSQSHQMEVVHSDDRGRFLTSGLRAGPYVVIAEANGFQRAEEKPITAGHTDLSIVMEKQGSVIVTVLDKNGRTLPTYHCNLRPAFEGQDSFGNRVKSEAVNGARDGKHVITGIDPMNYVVEIFADGHAKNYSAPFTITEGAQTPPEVSVQLDEGGVIEGVVTDSSGEPIPGVRVATRPNKWIDHEFVKMFPIAYKISQQETKTDRSGHYRFNMLYPGSYQVEFVHDGYCPAVLDDNLVEVGKTTVIPRKALSRGCMVSGIARYDGKAIGQIQVRVNAVADPANPIYLSCKAFTDNQGAYLIDKRLPPGRYEVMAAPLMPSNPLLPIIYMAKSKRPFTIAEGQEHLELPIDLPKMHE